MSVPVSSLSYSNEDIGKVLCALVLVRGHTNKKIKKLHLSPPFAVSVLGHQSIYLSPVSGPPTLRVKPTRKSDRGRCERSVTTLIITVTCFSVKLAVPCPEVLLLTSFGIIDVLGCQECCWCPSLLLCFWRTNRCQRPKQVVLWQSVCLWRPGRLLTYVLLLTSCAAADVQIASAISFLFLRTSKIIYDVL